MSERSSENLGDSDAVAMESNKVALNEALRQKDALVRRQENGDDVLDQIMVLDKRIENFRKDQTRI